MMRAREFESTRVLYHTSPKTNRASIMGSGLEPRIQQYHEIQRKPGVYMFETLPQAREWAYWSAVTDAEPFDIWAITVPGSYQLIRDRHPDMDIYNAVIGYETVPPEQLRLIKTQGVPKSTLRYPKRAQLVPSDITESSSQFLDILDQLRDAPITIFGSAATKGIDQAKDLDVFLDLDANPGAKKYVRMLLDLAHEHYGWLDPFVLKDGVLYVRNDQATGWQRAKNGLSMLSSIKRDAKPMTDLSESTLTEGSNYPVVVVDVQPEYSGMNDGDENPVFPEIIEFVALKQTGPVLMFVNAEDQGSTGDTVAGIKEYWEDTVRDLRGELDEIETITIKPQSFPMSHAKQLLSKSSDTGITVDGLALHESHLDDEHVLMLVDTAMDPAAFVGFKSRDSDRIWQVVNAITYPPFKGNALVAKIYKIVKEKYKKSIQSDIYQSVDAKRLWTKTLPALGIQPMIYDTDTGYIIDPNTTKINVYDADNPYRYTWIIEKLDHYSERDMLREGKKSILMPMRGIWSDKMHKRLDLHETTLINWNRFTIVDKGYGYFREFMDDGVEPRLIIKLIRYMYQKRVDDARDLVFPSFSKRTPDETELMHLLEEYHGVSFTINWTSVAQLKRFNGAYIVGGGRNECLREVELLMNAFNIRYKRIDSLVYG